MVTQRLMRGTGRGWHTGSNVLPQQLLDLATVPVDRILAAVRGGDVPPVELTVTYLSERMRVTNTPDGTVFVYERV
jgi:hypothetical protein